jgi:LacI family transcriptional regulator
MTTIHDVAKRAGVSIATVSNVINGSAKASAKTAERVLLAIGELNYIPNNIAKSLKKNTTKIVGILAEDIVSFNTPHIIDGICQQCESLGYHVNVVNMRVNRKVRNDAEDMYKDLAGSSEFQKSVLENVNTLLSARICGLIYIGVHPRDVSGLLPRLDIPVIYAYCHAKEPASDKTLNISYDDYQGARLAVHFIIEAGHTKIAIIAGMANSHATHRRMKGYRDALTEHSLPLHPEYILSGDWTHESGYVLADKLTNLPGPPTAAFVMNDIMAFGLIEALKEKGVRIPGDVSIHGFDDLQAAQFFTPALTTIALPLREIGRAAAESLIRMGENHYIKPDEPYMLIPCQHINRASVLGL